MKRTLRHWAANRPLLQAVLVRGLVARGRWRAKKGYAWAALADACAATRQAALPRWRQCAADQLRTTLSQLLEGSDSGSQSGQPLRNAFDCSRVAERARQFWSRAAAEDAVRLRKARNDGDAARQGNLLVLKRANLQTGEKGVLMLKYNDSFTEFAATYDLPKVFRHYRLVLEPSYAGMHESFFLFVDRDWDVVVQAPYRLDFETLQSLQLNLRPVRFGAGDWVDDSLFRPRGDAPSEYDVVMVASWSPIKRHQALFRALAELQPRRLRVLLIGYPLDWTRQRVEQLARRFGVLDQCTFLERIPPQDVGHWVARSRVSLFLSQHEGASKAVYESWFCDTPVIIYRHNVGFNREHLTLQTGMLADDRELAATLLQAIDHCQEFSPRAWAQQQTGCRRTTQQLNAFLREWSTAQGEPWTVDLVTKTNRPHLRYLLETERLAMEPAYMDLARLAWRGEFRS